MKFRFAASCGINDDKTPRRKEVMKRLLALAVLASLLASAALAQAATEVKMEGDARIYGNFWSKENYTGWNFNGTQTQQSLTIWERFRLKTDFEAGEHLKFRFAIRVNDNAWGGSNFLIDNPAVAIQVYLAYLQFKWPDTKIKFTVGYQDVDLPISVDWLGSNPVMGGTQAAGAVVEIPVVDDNFEIVTGFTRLLDGHPGFEATTTTKADRLDGYMLALPISLDTFKATPWGMVAVAGRDAPYGSIGVGDSTSQNQNLATNLLAPGTMAGLYGFSNAQNAYWWVGTTLSITALDPFKFYGDIIYGAGNGDDRKINKRQGLFFDLAAEYTGLDMVTPQLSFWYATGEDKSISNGSERLPTVVNYWGPTNSFLFDTNQEFDFGFMGVNPVGSWGFVAGLDKISFVTDLTHRLVFSYARGTNSPAGLRAANLLNGVGNYVEIGRDLTTQEQVYGVNFDTTYNIYENLAAILETGWSHGDFQTSVWTHRFTNATRNGDAWKVAFGLKYKF